MAREAYRSLYGDLKKLKDTSLLNDPAGGTGDDDELWQLLLATSEAVERYCNRSFATITETRTFDGPEFDADRLIVPDLCVLTTLTEDADDDQTFEVTWAASDYFLTPYDANPTMPWGTPFTSVLARKAGTKQAFKPGQQRYRLAGLWGYRDYKEVSGATINDAGGINASATTMNVSDATKLEIGETILIDGEQILITNIATNDITLRRGLNGTTAATHAFGSSIGIQRWPLPVERAALTQAARIWTRAPDFSPYYVDADLDSDVRHMLDSYRLMPVGL